MVEWERIEEIMDYLTNKYGPIAEPWDEVSEDTEALAWTLYLLWRYQNCGISKAEQKMLKDLMVYVMEEVNGAIYDWLVAHGYIYDPERYREVIEKEELEDPEGFWQRVWDYVDSEFPEEAQYLTPDEAKELYIDGLVEEYKEEHGKYSADVGLMRLVGETHEKLEKVRKILKDYLRFPDVFTVSELIIPFDLAVDTQHVYGDLLCPPYSHINVIQARELAEAKAEEGC